MQLDTVFLEPTTRCNLKCKYCCHQTGASNRRPPEEMDPKLFGRILEQLVRLRVRRVLFWGFGEPFLHPSYLEMCARLAHAGVHVVSNTNGHFIDDPLKVITSGLEEVIFSIDGATQETYTRYRRGGNFRSVMGNLEQLVAERERMSSPLRIVWQFIVFPWNEHEIAAVQNRAESLGIECAIKTNLGLSEHPSDPRHVRTVDARGRVRMTVGSFEDVSPKCRWPVILVDGRVAMCLYDSMGDYILADLRSDDLATAIEQTRWQRFWRDQQTDALAICRERCSCWYEPRNASLRRQARS